MSDYKNNRSTTYLLPLITIPFEKYKDRFVNSYITDTSMQIQTEEHLIIQLTASINDKILTEPDIITIYRKKIGSELFDIVVVKIPDAFINSYNKILLGLYSKVSIEAKNKILNFPLNKGNLLLKGVLGKSNWLKDALYKCIKSPVNCNHNTELEKAMDNIELEEMINEKDYLKSNCTEILN